MYNFAIPSTLKAWIDRIAVAGRTFRYTEEGPEGLAGGKRVVIASARGGLHANAPSDFQEPYLKFIFGFMGVRDLEFVRAEGLNLSPQHRNDALAVAHAAIGEAVAERSEEHTSELQSLMRISYAVFCLKKKKNNKA